MNFKFKRNIFGQQVLIIKEKTLGHFPGTWNYYWRKAKQDDIVKFMTEYEIALKDLQILKRIKENNPELLI